MALQTRAERDGFRKRYPELDRLLAHRAVIPGLEDGYVPQGIAWLGHGNLVLQSHYAEDKKRPGRTHLDRILWQSLQLCAAVHAAALLWLQLRRRWRRSRRS